MNRSKFFTITDAVRFDMSIHGARFIIWEFIFASIIIAGVITTSAIHYVTSTLSFFGGLWIFSFLGILFNCLVIVILARKISRKEGNRPAIVDKVNPKTIALLFTIYILTPYLLSFATCWQIKKN